MKGVLGQRPPSIEEMARLQAAKAGARGNRMYILCHHTYAVFLMQVVAVLKQGPALNAFLSKLRSAVGGTRHRQSAGTISPRARSHGLARHLMVPSA